MESRRVLVTGLPDGTDKTQLTIHFQSTRISGGGDIEDIELNEGGQAVITFEEVEAATRVFQKDSHRFQNCLLRVALLPESASTPNQDAPMKRDELSSSESEGDDQYTGHKWSKNPHVGKGEKRQAGFSAAPAAAAAKQATTAKRTQSHQPPTEQCTVKVTGLPEGVSEDSVWNYFENTRRSKGGPVSSVIMKSEIGVWLVTFESSDDAKNTVQHSPHVLNGSNLELSLFDDQEDMKSDDLGENVEPEEENSIHHAPRKQCTVKVTGLPEGVSEDLVYNYFENTRRSKGGPVSSVLMKPEIQMCLVTFESGDDARKTAEHSSHVLDGSSVEVSLLDDQEDMDPDDLRETVGDEEEDSINEATLTFIVSEISPKTTEDGVRNYFENVRRSGGGEISTIEYNEGVAVITFTEVKDIRRLLESSHSIDGKEVTVIKEPPKKKVPPDPLKVLVQGLDEKTTKDCLSFYLEKFSDVDVDEVYFGCDNNALVSFASEPDFSRLFDEVNKDTKGLEGAKPRLQRVPICSCILVTGLNEGTSDDTINLYFENTRRSGGKDVSHVERQGKNQALVHFEDPSSVEDVTRRNHVLEKGQLSLRPYYHFLEESATDPLNNGAVRNQTEVKFDPDVIAYIQTNHGTALQTLLEEYSANLSVDSETSTVIISPSNNEGCSQPWQERAETLEQFLNTFQKVKNDLASELFDEIKQRWQIHNSSQRQGNVLVSFDAANRFVQIIGKTEYVEKVTKELRDLIRAAEEDTELQKSIIRIDEDGIPRARLTLLQMSGLCERLQNENQHLSISADLKKEKLCLEGPRKLLQDVKVEVYKFTTKAVEKILELPKEVIDVLKQPPVSTFLQKLLEQNGVQAVVLCDRNLSPNEVQIVGVNSESTTKAEKLLRDNVQERSLNLTPENVQVLESRHWRDFKTSLTSKFKVGLTVVTSSSTLWVRGIVKDVRECMDEVKRYLDVYTILYSVVPLEQGSTKFLFKVWKSKLDDVKKELSTCFGDLREAPTGDGIEICGTAEGLEKCLPRIHKLINTIERNCVPVDKPGMKKFISHGKGPKHLKGIEDENHCVIITSETAVRDNSAIKPEMALEHPGASSGKCICSYVTQEGKKISVFKDDLTKHHVDAIVNAANGDLRHIGGLAAAIVQAGGEEIQSECDDYTRDHGTLLDGQAMYTTAGRLPCDRVIHVVGPRWDAKADSMRRDGKKAKQEDFLRYAITNSLGIAKTLRSIAIPAVSSGVFGFPRDLCAKVILDAVLDFSKENPGCNLSEIHLTNNDDQTAKEFAGEVRRRFAKTDSFVGNRVGGLRKTAAPNALTTPEGICITVKPGDLAQEKADVLVGTAAPNLSLKQNPCANALSQAAGPDLQKECTNIGTVPVGNIAVNNRTGNLNCGAVIFVICSSWDGGKGEKVLKKLVKKCLEKANSMKVTSIAFPAIGTGILQFPRGRVAEIYFDEVISYSRKHPTSQLKEVRFVLYDQDIPTVQAFEAELAKRVYSRVPFFAGNASSSSSSRRKNAAPVSHRTESRTPTFSPLKERKPDHLETSVDSLKFQVHPGDITQDTTDAIVTVSNPELDIARGGGVGAAILRSGGRSIQDECSTYAPQPAGSVFVTKAGRLNTRAIFHLIPSSGDLKPLILKCLEEAEKKAITSISFPAIGTGNLGGSAKSCAQMMLTVVREFSSRQPRSVQLVRMTIFQPDMLKDFRSAMKEGSGEKGTEEPGMFQRMGSAVKGFFGFGDAEETNASSLSMSKADDRQMFLLIFAGCQKDLQGAVKAVADMMTENCTQKVIENEAIKSLTRVHLQRFHNLELKNDVKVLVERVVERIVIRGQSEDILDTISEIHEILHEVKEEEHERSRAEMLSENVQWSWKDGGKFEEFESSLNARIETAYEQKKTKIVIDDGRDKFEVNLDSMTMKDLVQGISTEVRRIDLRKGLQLPESWDTQPKDSAGTDTTVSLFTLTAANNPKEYNDVSGLFLQSCQQPILKIERVQNPALYETYAVRRKKMDERKGSNEKLLFHGTPGKNCDQINHKGLNRNFCGKNATMYGNGVYFAAQAAYSARPQYSPPDANGLRYMYLVRVLVGEYTAGSQGLLAPPSKNPNDPTDTYDTVVDNVPNPGIFVAFYDWQCYPEYLITFQ